MVGLGEAEKRAREAAAGQVIRVRSARNANDAVVGRLIRKLPLKWIALLDWSMIGPHPSTAVHGPGSSMGRSSVREPGPGALYFCYELDKLRGIIIQRPKDSSLGTQDCATE